MLSSMTLSKCSKKELNNSVQMISVQLNLSTVTWFLQDITP